jgi:hypothetical protein
MPVYRVELIKSYLVDSDSKEELDQICQNWLENEKPLDGVNLSVNITEIFNVSPNTKYGFTLSKEQIELLNQPFSVLQAYRLPYHRAHNYYSYDKALAELKISQCIETIGDFLDYIQEEINIKGMAKIKGLLYSLPWMILTSFFDPYNIHFEFYNNRLHCERGYSRPRGMFRPIAILPGNDPDYRE